MNISEDRFEVVLDYYGVPEAVMREIARLGQPERKPLCKDHGVCPYVVRTMLDYSRYPQAEDVAYLLRQAGEDISRLSMLDFGCLVADYAVMFARLGAKVAIYDDVEAVKFPAYRLAREGFDVEIHTLPTEGDLLMKGKDLVVFGEVLEHLEDPLVPIRACIAQGVKYIFTSCYPFGDDEYYTLSGHLKSAQDLQSDCIRLLIGHYDALPSRDKSVLWRRREPVAANG
ncbi:hypothetical protein [Caulobacter endophyticus]|uniref:hypothetical protein n=1 Tax=Caulobacter endophyticus TaxID=2172652 RepID=UPI00240EACEB|nr:hypothetical protein [Caulobacter endophyticus]MDG2527897.1 hypothetical protein [Caulobacter endophyticus]